MSDTRHRSSRRLAVLATACAAVLVSGASTARAGPEGPAADAVTRLAGDQSAPPWCTDTTSTTAILLHKKLLWILTTEGEYREETRAAWKSQPRLQRAEVTWVRDEAQCAAASRMLDSAMFDPPKAAPVYLLRIGARYAAASTQGGFLAVTDSTLRPLLLTEF